MAKLDLETLEQLFHDPDWDCPKCGFVNRAIRSSCRNPKCTFRWEDDMQMLVVGQDGVARPWDKGKQGG